MSDNELLDIFVSKVKESAKYAQIESNLVRQIALEELKNQKDQRAALKSTRTRLHRLTGAFLTTKLDYAKWLGVFEAMPDKRSEEFLEARKAMIKLHASTHERLPFLELFFQVCLAPVAPISSLLDLACGLNPLALPWMPLADHCEYHACDVVEPLTVFLQNFFTLTAQPGSVFTCNLLESIPQQPVQVAFLLKLLPILDQVDPNASSRLLEQVQADHLLVSYPSKSLSGRSKGMKQTYAEHLERVTAGKGFQIRSFDFPNETAYLLSR